MSTSPTKLEILRLCGETIITYSGDPLALEAFINSIDLIHSIVTDAHVPLLVSFVKTRLHGRALEAISGNDSTIESIKSSLRRQIKPENEKIIRGKMAALRADNVPLQDFAKQAEGLADSLKRALVLDGIPGSKANAILTKLSPCANRQPKRIM